MLALLFILFFWVSLLSKSSLASSATEISSFCGNPGVSGYPPQCDFVALPAPPGFSFSSPPIVPGANYAQCLPYGTNGAYCIYRFPSGYDLSRVQNPFNPSSVRLELSDSSLSLFSRAVYVLTFHVVWIAILFVLR